MKKGICQGAFPSNLSVEECIEIAAKAGFDGIELVLEDPGRLNSEVISEDEILQAIAKSVGMDQPRKGAITLSTTVDRLHAIKERAQENGIEISSIASMLHWFYRFTSPSKKQVEQALLIGETLIQYAAILGAKTVLIVPGLVTPRCSYAEAYDRAYSNINKLIPLAEEKNVTLGIENVWNRFLLSPLEMRRFIESFNNSHVGVYFDIGNILAYGFPSDWITTLDKHIKAIHCKDYIRQIGNIQGFTYLLQGDINWERVLRSLRQIEYGGYITVEVPPYKSVFASKAVFDSSTSLDKILSINSNFDEGGDSLHDK